MKVTVVGLGAEDGVTADCPDHLAFLKARGAEIARVTIRRRGPLRRLPALVRLMPRLLRSDLVVTDEYFNAAFASLLLRVVPLRIRHVVVGLNVSGNRTLSTPFRPLNIVINFFLQRMDLIFVASRAEAPLFAELHGLPLERFSFVHWAYDLPDETGSMDLPDVPFFCMIGRNNRDIRTFCDALEGTPYGGLLICDPAPAEALPDHVRVWVGVPMGDCIRALRHSVANVIVVNDAGRGAGHITLVTAMHCGKAQILSRVPPMADYFVDGRHAITVGLGRADELRAAMYRLAQDPDACEAMGDAARRHAARWLTHARRARSLEDRIRAWLDTGRVQWQDLDWWKEHDG